MNTRREMLQAALGASVLSALPVSEVHSQTAELEQLAILYGFPPGSSGDSISRRLAERLVHLGYAKRAVVDNRTGAGGRIALDFLKAAAADGSVLCITPASMMTVYPHTYTKLSYSPLRDFSPVATVAKMHFGMAVGPLVPASVKTVKEYLDWAKANPQHGSYGSAATGSTPHFVGALLNLMSGSDLRHVGYRGSVPGINDVIGGQIPAMFTATGDFIPQYKAGNLRILATSGRERLTLLPEVATFAEQGFPDLVIEEWFGVFAPAKTPTSRVNRASEMFRAATHDRAFVEALGTFGLIAHNFNAEETAKSLRAEIDWWGPRVKKIGFSPES